jgi:peptidoglycan/xylan/chitin deacetylase (PgdA/CDA1 family)
LFTKFNTATIKQGNIAGVSTVHGKYKDLQNTYDLSGVDGFSLWVYCDGPLANSGSSVGSSVLLALGDATMANASGCNICGVGGGSFRRGWNNIRVTKTDFTIQIGGTAHVNWSTVKRAQIRFTPDASYTGNPFYIDSLFVGGFAENKKAPVVVTFDDSNEESILLTRIMNSYGIPTTSFVIKDFIDSHQTQPGYQTLEQLKEIYDRGNAICVHGNVTNEFVVSPEKMRENRQWLIDNGFVREQGYNYLSYPNGTFNDTTIDSAIKYGFLGCRSISGLNRNDASNTHESISNNDLENIVNGGIANAYKINSSRPANAAAALATVDKAIARQSAAIFYWHTLAELSQAEAAIFAAGIKTRIDAGTVDAMTFPSFVQKYRAF